MLSNAFSLSWLSRNPLIQSNKCWRFPKRIVCRISDRTSSYSITSLSVHRAFVIHFTPSCADFLCPICQAIPNIIMHHARDIFADCLAGPVVIRRLCIGLYKSHVSLNFPYSQQASLQPGNSTSWQPCPHTWYYVRPVQSSIIYAARPLTNRGVPALPHAPASPLTIQVPFWYTWENSAKSLLVPRHEISVYCGY